MFYGGLYIKFAIVLVDRKATEGSIGTLPLTHRGTTCPKGLGPTVVGPHVRGESRRAHLVVDTGICGN